MRNSTTAVAIKRNFSLNGKVQRNSASVAPYTNAKLSKMNKLSSSTFPTSSILQDPSSSGKRNNRSVKFRSAKFGRNTEGLINQYPLAKQYM